MIPNIGPAFKLEYSSYGWSARSEEKFKTLEIHLDLVLKMAILSAKHESTTLPQKKNINLLNTLTSTHTSYLFAQSRRLENS